DDLWDSSPMLGTRLPDGTYRPGAGAMDILFGRHEWPAVVDLLLPPDDMRMVEIEGADPNDAFGYGMTLGDANGDGRVDAISNGRAGDGCENQGLDAGEFYVVDNRALFDGTTGPLPPALLNIDIQPIFSAACLPCHGGDAPNQNLRLDYIQHSMVDLF